MIVISKFSPGYAEKDKHDYDWTKDHHDWSKQAQTESYSGDGDFKPSPEIDSYNTIPTFSHVDSYNQPINQNFDDDGYMGSHKSLRTESFHITEAKDSSANNPISQHYVTGSYKVHESDPQEYVNHKVFQAPLANINLHETSYQPTGPEHSQQDFEMEKDSYGGDEGLEDDDYGESTLSQMNKEPEANGYEIEALKQYFLNGLK